LESQTFDLPFEAGLWGPKSIAMLQNKIASAQANGGQVYFFGLFDQDEAAWNAFLGARCGVPYEMVRPYRERSTLTAQVMSDGKPITLYRLK
jgi:hypothetical protein